MAEAQREAREGGKEVDGGLERQGMGARGAGVQLDAADARQHDAAPELADARRGAESVVLWEVREDKGEHVAMQGEAGRSGGGSGGGGIGRSRRSGGAADLGRPPGRRGAAAPTVH